jgi:ribonuclease HII
VAEAADSKGAVLAEALGRLLRWNVEHLSGQEPLTVFIDKHGGRNTYAAQLQHGLPDSIVLARQESLARSVYDVQGLHRRLTLTFQPRADAEHFCVALASMTSKYLREVLMREFNAFWLEHVPGLKPTAGYPGDSARFLTAIRPAFERLQLNENAVWRRR